MGRSNIMPRETREHKLHVADTVSYNTGRMNWKFGGDFLQAWIYNYYPAMYGGEFYFDNVKVNPWLFTPEKYGEPLTPLRAYAHDVPRYYMQDFGNAQSNPNSRSYAGFAQNTIRVAHNFTVNVGLRYDLQTFEVPGSGEQSGVCTGRQGSDCDRQLLAARGIHVFPGPTTSVGAARRLWPVLYPDPEHVCVAGRDR